MNKKKTIVVLLAIIMLISAYYLFTLDFVKPGIDSENINLTKNNPPVLSKIDKTGLKIKYENEFSACLKDYETVINEEVDTEQISKNDRNDFFEKLNEAENKLLEMIVPEDFKKSHLETVLVVSKINEIFESQDTDNFNTAKEMLAQVKLMNTDLLN
jgi:hypothetical protein